MDFQIKGLNHFAWRCRNAEETRAFYEDILGLPLAHVIRADRVPSTGESLVLLPLSAKQHLESSLHRFSSCLANALFAEFQCEVS